MTDIDTCSRSDAEHAETRRTHRLMVARAAASNFTYKNYLHASSSNACSFPKHANPVACTILCHGNAAPRLSATFASPRGIQFVDRAARAMQFVDRAARAMQLAFRTPRKMLFALQTSRGTWFSPLFATSSHGERV